MMAQICKACGHEHASVRFGFICIGCPCEERPAKRIPSLSQPSTAPDVGEISDGYHTFNELYDHRHTLFLALCRVMSFGDRDVVWRSQLHSDCSKLEGWFIMGIGTEPGMQISYHLPLARWTEADFAATYDRAPVFDGHTSADVLKRLRTLYQF